MTIIEAERLKMPFGRYGTFTLGEIAARDVAYLDFLAGISPKLDLYLQEAIALMCEKHGRAVKVTVARRDAGQGELFQPQMNADEHKYTNNIKRR